MIWILQFLSSCASLCSLQKQYSDAEHVPLTPGTFWLFEQLCCCMSGNIWCQRNVLNIRVPSPQQMKKSTKRKKIVLRVIDILGGYKRKLSWKAQLFKRQNRIGTSGDWWAFLVWYCYAILEISRNFKGKCRVSCDSLNKVTSLPCVTSKWLISSWLWQFFKLIFSPASCQTGSLSTTVGKKGVTPSTPIQSGKIKVSY